MWRILVSVRRNVRNMRKSPKVADESMVVGVGAGAADHHHQVAGRRPAGGFSAGYGLYRVLASVIGCFAGPAVSGVDGMWASGEFGQASEMNHLMVSDSMRYAILM